MIGFTNGIALVIASTQLKDFFGITLPGAVPGEFLGRLEALAAARRHASSPTTAGVGIGVIVLILVWNRVLPRVPGYIVALVAGTAIVWPRCELPVETIGSRFGGLPSGLPDFRMPVFRTDLVLTLLSPTLTVAMLGAIESLMSAVVADRMTGKRHNSNVELFAQGIANIVSPHGRRSACDRRPRADGDEHPLRRTDAGGRHDPRADAAGRSSASPHRSPRPYRWPCSPASCWWWPATWASGTRLVSSGSRAGPTVSCGW